MANFRAQGTKQLQNYGRKPHELILRVILHISFSRSRVKAEFVPRYKSKFCRDHPIDGPQALGVAFIALLKSSASHLVLSQLGRDARARMTGASAGQPWFRVQYSTVGMDPVPERKRAS